MCIDPAPKENTGGAEVEISGQEGIVGEGPYMLIALSILVASDSMGLEQVGEVSISAARFETYGCPAAIACGNWLCQWVTGKTPAQVKVIEAEDLIRMLGGLPLGKEHCADLAVKALRSALRQVELKLKAMSQSQ